jgi:hypothetical protein
MSDQRRDDGGPAFTAYDKAAPHQGIWYLDGHAGLSLRDYFAGQALAGMCGGLLWPKANDATELALRAYLFADALLRERAK